MRSARRDHDKCFHQLRLDICFDEYNYHDSGHARVIKGTGHLELIRDYSEVIFITAHYTKRFISGCVRPKVIIGC